ncbi:MAG: TetR/AcrR family transcriptional regulator [Chromatiales bacterium]|nr:TetR/AcrR family transcriptional regulator [Chromatiales bacterium]
MDPIATRRLEEKERRRNDILDAAERVASATGLESLTMDQVAREARLSRGLLYVYFQDRDDLVAGICERALIGLHGRFAALADDTRTGLERVVAMGRAYVDFATECPLQFEILARFEATDASAAVGGSNHGACLAAGARVHALLTAALDAGMRDGSVAPSAGSPGTIALSLWAMTHGTIQVASMKRAVLTQQGVTPGALVEQTLRMATMSLKRGE